MVLTSFTWTMWQTSPHTKTQLKEKEKKERSLPNRENERIIIVTLIISNKTGNRVNRIIDLTGNEEP